MIIFLYGEDSFRSLAKLNEIIDSYKKVHKSGLNLVDFDCQNNEFEDLKDNFKIVGMFAEKKLIILKNLFLSKKFQEDFQENVKELNDIKDVIVVFEKDKVDERLKLFKLLKKEAKAQEFNYLSGVNLLNWTKNEFAKYGAKIDTQALDLLLNFVGSDLWQLHNEVLKLSNYKAKQIINSDDIKLLVRPKIDSDIFKTIEAVANKDKKLAINLIKKHILAEDSGVCFYLLSMIAYQIKTLLIIKDLVEKNTPYAMIAKKAGLHPFVVQKNYYFCNKFTLSELKKIYRRIYEVDFDIKTGKLDPELGIETLIFSL